MGRRSITWPPVLEGGRLEMTPDPDTATPEQLDVELGQIVALSLLPMDSANPWNEGLGLRDATWSGTNRTDQAKLRQKIRERFQGLERSKRARLLDVTFRRAPSGGLVSVVEYTSMETSRKGREENPVG